MRGVSPWSHDFQGHVSVLSFKEETFHFPHLGASVVGIPTHSHSEDG